MASYVAAYPGAGFDCVPASLRPDLVDGAPNFVERISSKGDANANGAFIEKSLSGMDLFNL